jgi:hypothetical protein
MHIAKLYDACQRSWDADTSYNTDYGNTVRSTVGERAYGQCAVTSLVVHDRLGGEFFQALVRWEGSSILHYWIELADVGAVDFTWAQFPAYAGRSNIERIGRDRLLPGDNDWMQDRYKLLSMRVGRLFPAAVDTPAESAVA